MNKVKKILGSLLVLFFAINLSSCKDDVEEANKKYYSDITAKLSLSRAYSTNSFLDDGIGPATVEAYTDGDTTRFALQNTTAESIAVRYYCIDTPESTSNVQKWGKAASLFTKTQLSAATEVVLESSTSGVPVKDSYGTRYLAYVWYKTAEHDFRLLNLEIVENGFSENKCSGPSDKYYEYFKQAENFATKNKLRVHAPSSLVDPLYSTDPIDMTLKQFWGSEDSWYDKDAESGALVKINLFITGLSIASSGTYTYKGAELNDDGSINKKAISLYAGYVDGNILVGNQYTFVGNIDLHSRSYQIKGFYYDADAEVTSRSTLLVKSKYYYRFDSTLIDDDSAGRFKTLYNSLTVTSATTEDNILTIVGTAQSQYKKTLSTTVETFTITLPVTAEQQSGSKFKSIKAGATLKVSAFRETDDVHVLDAKHLDNITVSK